MIKILKIVCITKLNVYFIGIKINSIMNIFIYWYGLVGMMFCYPIKRFDQNPSLIFKSVMIPIAYGFYPQISNIRHSCLPSSGAVSYGICVSNEFLMICFSNKQVVHCNYEL